MNLPGSPLTADDYARHASCGIPKEFAESALLRRVESIEGGELIGRNGHGDYAGIVYPYVWPGENCVRESRLRRDRPDLEQKPGGGYKERMKYLTPPGRGNMLYFVPGTNPEWLQDTDIPVVFVEGEKKAIAVGALGRHEFDASPRPRWLPIAIPGVWSWKGTIGKQPGPNGDRRDVKGVIPDFDRVKWSGRRVTIIFDANVRTVEQVRIARLCLTRELQRRGATVLWVDLPELPGVNGIDDFSGKHAPEPTINLIYSGRPPEGSIDNAPVAAVLRIEDLPGVGDSAEAIEYIRKPELVKGSVLGLTGNSGSGKSTLARAFIRDAIRDGVPCLILDRENPRPVARDCMERIGLDDGPLLRWYGGWNGDVPSAMSSTVIDWVKSCKTKPIVMFDSLIAFVEGDENSSQDMHKFMKEPRKLADLGCTVIVIHHDGKAETSKDFRGSTAFKGDCDQAFHVSNLSPDMKLDRLTLRPFKSRFGLCESLVYFYAGGKFIRDDREDAPARTITDQLTDLLRVNPGIKTKEFEDAAAKKDLGRNKAREFLSNGVLSGAIRREDAGRNQFRHYLPEGQK
jgi:hypothetical protein